MAMRSSPPSRNMKRRTFLKSSLSAGALYFLPKGAYLRSRGARAGAKKTAPSDKVNLALVGVGGRGGSLGRTFHTTGLANIVALCDVDMGGRHTAGSEKRFPNAPKFKDFRKMFDKMAGKIDAVQIAVPDHAHFPIAMLAMSLGKHIYVEKPLAQTFQEAELMMAAEKKYKVAAQMGNQGHSGYNYLQFEAWVNGGIIKDVTRVDAFMNRARRWHGWKITGYPTGEPKPATLDWDLWLSARPFREYSSKLHPGNWRSWYDFGNGAFGDWGPHTLDTTHRFLKLGLPIETEALKLDGPNKWIFPQASTIAFRFPARGEMPPVTITWYDGVKNLPPRPKELGAKRRMDSCGKIIYGKEFVFKGGTHSATLRIIPESKMKEVAGRLPKTTGRHSSHAANFLLAAMGREKTRSSFDISGPLTQVFLLGVIAQRLGGKLVFDPKTKQITNNEIANKLLVGYPPRKGWEQYYKMA